MGQSLAETASVASKKTTYDSPKSKISFFMFSLMRQNPFWLKIAHEINRVFVQIHWDLCCCSPSLMLYILEIHCNKHISLCWTIRNLISLCHNRQLSGPSLKHTSYQPLATNNGKHSCEHSLRMTIGSGTFGDLQMIHILQFCENYMSGIPSALICKIAKYNLV